jgi:hypothetical protein
VLLWAYLQRCHEPPAATAKRIEPVVRAIFPPGRRSLQPLDISPYLVASIPNFIAVRHFAQGSELILGLLQHVPSTSETTRGFPDGIAPERMIAGIRALMLTIDCIEQGNEPFLPPSPTSTEDIEHPEPSNDFLNDTVLARPGMQAFVDNAKRCIGRIAMAIDSYFSNSDLFDDQNVVPRMPAQSTTDPLSYRIFRPNGAFTVAYPRDRQPYYNLLSACFDSWPRFLATDSPELPLIRILFRGLTHIDPQVGFTARRALQRLVKSNNSLHIIESFCTFISKPDFILHDNASYQAAATVEVDALVRLWVELLTSWSEYLRFSAPPAVSGDKRQAGGWGMQTAPITRVPLEDIDSKSLRSTLLSIEGTGCALLCSQSPAVRRRALDALRVASVLFEALSKHAEAGIGSEVGGRAIRVLEEMPDPLTKIGEEDINGAERARLSKWRKHEGSDTLIRIIESDNMADFALWQRLVSPTFLALLKDSPSAIAAAKPLIASRVMRLYPAASLVAGLAPGRVPTPASGRSSAAAVPDAVVLADNWRSHLTSLCTITSTANAVSTVDPTFGEQPTLERLSSGSDLLRLITPFLASDNPLLREGVVSGMCNIHPNLYRALLDGLNSIIRHLAEDRRGRREQRTPAKRSTRLTRLHVSVTKVYELTSRFLPGRDVAADESIFQLIANYIREMYVFFREPDLLADDASLSAMRRSFCVVTQTFVECTSSSNTLSKWLPSEFRHNLFTMFDEWCFRPIIGAPTNSPDLARKIESASTGPPSIRPARARRSSSSASATQAISFEVFLPAAKVMACFCVSCRSNFLESHMDGAKHITSRNIGVYRSVALGSPDNV